MNLRQLAEDIYDVAREMQGMNHMRLMTIRERVMDEVRANEKGAGTPTPGPRLPRTDPFPREPERGVPGLPSKHDLRPDYGVEYPLKARGTTVNFRKPRREP